MKNDGSCCWVCGRPAVDYYLVALHDSALPEIVPLCDDPACEQRLRCCAEKKGGLKGHPCSQCEDFLKGRCGCVS